MILLENCKWNRTKGQSRIITALRMLLGLSYNLPLDDKVGKMIADEFKKTIVNKKLKI